VPQHARDDTPLRGGHKNQSQNSIRTVSRSLGHRFGVSHSHVMAMLHSEVSQSGRGGERGQEKRGSGGLRGLRYCTQADFTRAP
jgi:hypothetical protein